MRAALSHSHVDPFAAARAWFAGQGFTPFPFQEEVWAAYAAGESGLVHAPTGMGKTYAAALGPLVLGPAGSARPAAAADAAVDHAAARARERHRRSRWRARRRRCNAHWTVDVRTGDTSSSARARQAMRLPTALVTTPESLTLLLSRADWRERFAHVDAVIVDEWHELLASKRGVQIELALARLRALRPAAAHLGPVGDARQPRRGARLPRGHRPRARAAPHAHRPRPRHQEDRDRQRAARDDRALPVGRAHRPQDAAAKSCARSSGRARTLVFTNVRSADRDLVPGAARGASGLGRADRAASRLARARRARLGREPACAKAACARWCARRASTSASTSRRSTRCCRSAARRAWRGCCSAPGAAATGPARSRSVTVVPTQALELVEAAAARDGGGARRIEPRTPVDRSARRARPAPRHLRAGRRLPAGRAARRGARHARLSPRSPTTSGSGRSTSSCTAARASTRIRNTAAWSSATTASRTCPTPASRAGTACASAPSCSDASIAVQFRNGAKLGHVEESFIARSRPGDCFVFAGRVLEFIRVRELTAWVKPAAEVVGARAALDRQQDGAVDELAERHARADRAARRAATSRRPSWQLRAAAARAAAALVGAARASASGWSRRSRRARATASSSIRSRAASRTSASPRCSRTGCARSAADVQPITANDYGFGLLSAQPVELYAAATSAGCSPRPTSSATSSPASTPPSSDAASSARSRASRGSSSRAIPGSRTRNGSCRRRAALLYDVFAEYDPRQPAAARRRCARCWNASSKRRASPPRSRACAAAGCC